MIALLISANLIAQIPDCVGSGYIDSVNTVLLARDLTDEEIDNADNARGSGYHDGRVAAEDAPYYSSFFYEDEHGNWIIQEDDDNEIYSTEDESKYSV